MVHCKNGSIKSNISSGRDDCERPFLISLNSTSYIVVLGLCQLNKDGPLGIVS